VKPTFFASPAELRAWFEAHHERLGELLVGYHKRGTGVPSVTWPESVDEALCFGWIDGVRRRVDDERYTIRFTPRKQRSTWSAVNLKRVPELVAQGLMRPAGLRAYEARDQARSGTYSYEQRHAIELPADYEATLRGNKKAWTFFSSQPPWYRRACAHWIVSAKKEETRKKRLAVLVADSAKGKTVPPLTRPPKSP
jgi:uncharacterized protein YdeI (YjbR/CyaY-like superfamily)